MKKIIIYLSTIIGLMACYDTEKVFTRSYVMYYGDLKEIVLYQKVSVPPTKRISIGGETYFTVGYLSTGRDKEQYDALCEKNNDMTFNRKVFTVGQGGPRRIPSCFTPDIVSINIVSNTDFDDAHPTGESLSDIVKFRSASYKPYIDNGYKGKERTPFEGLLSELTPDQLILLDGIGDLYFESQPTLSKTHNFTVTMTADDGRVFSDTIEITFE